MTYGRHRSQLVVGPLYRVRLGPALCQEFIEFLFVLRGPQVIEEIVKITLFIFQAPQSLCPIFLEGLVASWSPLVHLIGPL